ncbi:MAG: class I adenylate cyclase [Gammaproteobacteria bacterium]|nr:class I adenylate cyclase [Gammaproteobacteria bacterium]
MSRLPSRFSEAELAEGLDRKQFNTLRKRFLGLNRDRFGRMRGALRERQRDFVDALPLLLHINHPLLPGFQDFGTPCSIADYSPGNAAVQAAKRLLGSFHYERRASLRHDIQSLFLIGSTGTLGHSGESDLDIWVVYRPDLPEETVIALRAKLDAISLWARELNVEAHCFLMEPDSFRENLRASLNAEDCGTTQHYLLLDEFYRTAILLAGKPPLWWMVPPEQETNYEAYAHRLLHQRYLRAGDFVDFGGLATLPANEFFGAALWQLYKAIDSPYKSVLKLLLMESYARDYPALTPLSLRFKQAVYASEEPDLDALDPYLMMFQRVEAYLREHGEPKRIELVRRCFYLKVNERLSLPYPGIPNWRRARLEQLVRSWGWPEQRLVELDNRRRWKVQWAQAERKLLVNELVLSYRYLSAFARRDASLARISQADLNLLGRKLYASFERRAGKLEFVNPQVAPDLSEECLSFVHSPGESTGESGWLVFSGEVHAEAEASGSLLRRGRELLEVLAWAFFNGLLTPGTHLVLGRDAPLSLREFQALVRDLIGLYPGELPEATDEDFRNPARLASETVFVNLGLDPMAERSKQGLALVSSRTDSLAYGGFSENLVLRLDSISQNSWRELTLRHQRGPRAVPAYLQAYGETLLNQTGMPPRLAVRCHSSTRSAAIARRVEILLEEFGQALRLHGEALRYLLELGAGYALVQVDGKAVSCLELADDATLAAALAEPLSRYRRLVVDSQALRRGVYAALAGRQQPGQVLVVLARQGEDCAVHLLDERGALFTMPARRGERDSLLNPYRLFLDAVAYRQNAAGGAAPDVRYFELIQTRTRSRPSPRPTAASRSGAAARNSRPWNSARNSTPPWPATSSPCAAARYVIRST